MTEDQSLNDFIDSVYDSVMSRRPGYQVLGVSLRLLKATLRFLL
jgi:hypothetical protein